MTPRKRDPKDRAEHQTNTEARNREKHQRGQKRKAMAKGKDKKRQQRNWFQR